MAFFGQRSSSFQGGNGFRPSFTDRIGSVVGYRTRQEQSGGSSFQYNTIVVREDDTGRIYEARIDPHAVITAVTNTARSSLPGNARRFRGNIIDQKMQQAVPAGARVVLEKTAPVPGGKVMVDNEQHTIVNCSYVVHITAANPNKTLRCVFTFKAGDFIPNPEYARDNPPRMSVQIWDYDRAFDPSSQEDMSELQKILEDSTMRASEGIGYSGCGFALRVKVSHDEARRPTTRGEPPAYDIIDYSDGIDRIRNADADTATAEPVAAGEQAPYRPKSHAPTMSDVLEYVESYKAYLFGDGKTPGRLAWWTEAAVTPVVELVLYDNYYVSNYFRDAGFWEKPNVPLYRLAYSSSVGTKGETTPMYGRNLACHGIVEFSHDGLDQTTGKARKVNSVRRLFYHGASGNIHSFIRAADGLKGRVIPELDIVRQPYSGASYTPAPQPQANNPQPAVVASASLPPTSPDPALPPVSSSPVINDIVGSGLLGDMDGDWGFDEDQTTKVTPPSAPVVAPAPPPPPTAVQPAPPVAGGLLDLDAIVQQAFKAPPAATPAPPVVASPPATMPTVDAVQADPAVEASAAGASRRRSRHP